MPFLLGKQPHALEHGGVGFRAGNIVPPQAPIERDRFRERFHILSGTILEPSAPRNRSAGVFCLHAPESGAEVLSSHAWKSLGTQVSNVSNLRYTEGEMRLSPNSQTPKPFL